MPITIALTDKIRKLPYFSDFKEEEVEVPDKPFLWELLDESLDLEALSVEELCECIETCIYFAFYAGLVILELLWKIGVNDHTFNQWFTREQRPPVRNMKWKPRWRLNYDLPDLVRKELAGVLEEELVDCRRLMSLGIRWLEEDYGEVISAGNLRLLKWTRSTREEPLFNLMNIASAARYGHLDILKYMREEGCPWDERCTNAAVQGGHLECLKYLREQGCPWNKQAIVFAIENGDDDCWTYLRQHGCPGP